MRVAKGVTEDVSVSGAFLTSFPIAPVFEAIKIEARRSAPDLVQLTQYALELVCIRNDGDNLCIGSAPGISHRIHLASLRQNTGAL